MCECTFQNELQSAPAQQQGQGRPNKQNQQKQSKPSPKPRLQPRKMDLSEYDNANDDAVSASNAPESAATSDERV